MKIIINTKFALLAVFAGLFLTASAQAATYTVDRTDDATVQTCTAAANDCTLRGAIAAANAAPTDDTINFDATVFNAQQTITLTQGQLTIANFGALTIIGTGANLLTISGGGTSRVFLVNAGATVGITTLTISNGNVGGGEFGAGISNNGTLTIVSVTVSNNVAGIAGGGIANAAGSVLTVNSSTINTNYAGSSGGGIYNANNTLTVTNSTISGNTAQNAGGGGIRIEGNSTVTLNSATFSDNSSADGGGISVRDTSTVTLNNTIIANSPAGGDCSTGGGTVNATYSLIEANLTCVNGTNTNNLTGDPNLGPLQNNGGTTQTQALPPGSIAIDTGNSAQPTDQRGLMRPVDNPNSPNGTGNLSDIGAFEVQRPTAAGVSVSGRVVVGSGAGVSNAVVTLTDSSGITRTARTSSFGYYRFDDVEGGQTYVISIQSKRYSFTPQIVNVIEETTEINFAAQ